jgi:hypothetical protein
MNSLIEALFKNFIVNGNTIPIAFLDYKGHETTYITYQNIDTDNSFSGDDEILGYVDYYDIDIFSKGNYLKVVEEVKKIMKTGGFMWMPSRTSQDMYEEDTGMYHKTLCFAIEREE